LVIVDLVLNAPEELRKIPQTSWYRLQRLVEAAPTACLILSRQSRVSSAQLKIVLDNSWTLETLETDDAISRSQFRVQRSHIRQLESAIAERINVCDDLSAELLFCRQRCAINRNCARNRWH